MEQDVGQMVAARLQAPQRTVRHVREPRQRMPVGCMHGGKGPLCAVNRKTLVHPRVFIDVLFVVEIDESVSRGRDVEAKRNRENEQPQKKGIWFLELPLDWIAPLH